MGETEILNTAATQGIFAILFVALFFYVIRTTDKREQKSEAREKRLIEALDKAQTNNQQLAIAVEKLARDVEYIKDTIPRREMA